MTATTVRAVEANEVGGRRSWWKALVCCAPALFPALLRGPYSPISNDIDRRPGPSIIRPAARPDHATWRGLIPTPPASSALRLMLDRAATPFPASRRTVTPEKKGLRHNAGAAPGGLPPARPLKRAASEPILARNGALAIFSSQIPFPRTYNRTGSFWLTTVAFSCRKSALTPISINQIRTRNLI